MTKIQITQEQEKEILRHFSQIYKRIDDECDKMTAGAMTRIKSSIEDRFNIMITESFKTDNQ